MNWITVTEITVKLRGYRTCHRNYKELGIGRASVYRALAA
jgi:hypothetical protein